MTSEVGRWSPRWDGSTPDSASSPAWARWLGAMCPAGVYLGVQTLGVLLLWAMSAAGGHPLDLAPWDGLWYVDIARYGDQLPAEPSDRFGHDGSNTIPAFALTFFPGYPMLVRLTGMGLGSHYVLAAVLLSAVAGVAGAFAVARLAYRVNGSRQAALLAVALFAAAPMSITYSLAYADVLFVALAMWSLVGLTEQRWLLAGWTTFAAGLTRPTAVALVPVVMAWAAWHVWRRREIAPAPAIILAPLGLLFYLAWVAIQTHSWTGYQQLQEAGFGLRFDGGAELGHLGAHALASHGDPSWAVAIVCGAVVAISLLVVAVRRLPWALWAYAMLVTVLALSTSGVSSTKLRELLPAVVLVLPIAGWLARQRPAFAITITTSVLALGLWVGAWALTAWQQPI